MKKTILAFFLFALSINSLRSQTLAFPTAEGYGMWATGGRGGKVVEVTNLKDLDRYGTIQEGSFRWALNQYPGEPLTVVFKVSGVIELGAELKKKRDSLTIAGQTAPGDGICVKGGKVNFGGSNNLIIRYLRFRVGLTNSNGFIAGAALGIENGSNFIIDHCTFGWSSEENMTIYDNNLSTVQRCILHEGLYDTGHDKGQRSYGSQWGGQTATYHHNLLAHNNSRTPRVNGAKNNDINVLMDYVNNVNYNWGKANSAYGGEMQDVAQSMRCNMVNNYYKPGPARPGSSYSYFVQSIGSTTELTPEWHLSGNYMEGTANAINNTDNYEGLDVSVYTDQGINKDSLISIDPFEVPYSLNIETAQEAYNSVLESVGPFPRDSVDLRIIQEVTDGTASGSGSFGDEKGIIDHPDAVGGFPTYNTYNIVADSDHDGMADYWETANGLDTTNSEDRNLLTNDGYTYLEAYLNGLVGEELNDITYPEPVFIEETGIDNIVNDISEWYISSTGNTIIINESLTVNEYSLFDMNGRMIKRHSGIDIKQVDVSNLQSGVYIFRMKMDDNRTKTTLFIR